MKPAISLSLCLAALLTLSAPASAGVDDRMAGAIHHDAVAQKPKTPVANAPVRTEMNFTRIESFGLLNNLKDGGLGIDLWNNSDRQSLVLIIPEAPTRSYYPVLLQLTRRALLSKADAGMIQNNTGGTQDGNDLLTLRIEKLTEAGNFAEAVRLYTQNPDQPYHERLARAGIVAMLYNGDVPLACLETKAMQARFSEHPFWQSLAGFCDYELAQIGGKELPADAIKNITSSELLHKAMQKDNFRFTPKSTDDIEALSTLEKAMLFANGRIDYSGLKKVSFKNTSALVSALMLQDDNLPDALRYRLLVQAVSEGRKNIADLTAFYDSLKVGGKDNKGWKQTAFLYKAAKDGDSAARQKAVAEALALAGDINKAALLPLAGYIAETDPEKMPAESIRAALWLSAESGQKLSSAWEEKWKKFMAEKKEKSENDLFLTVAYDIATGFSTGIAADIMPESQYFQDYTKGLSENRTDILYIVYEKLDKSKKLHNYEATNVYDKPEGLTFVDDYVMPSMDLMNSLEKAQKEESLGETVLLSSLALHSIPPEKIYAGLIQEVFDGFNTVGLTNEARELAKEVSLGLSY